MIAKIFMRPLTLISIPYVWLLVFFLTPFAIILKISFAELVIGLPPYSDLVEWLDHGVIQIRLTLSNYMYIFDDGLYVSAYLSSLTIAGCSTVVCLIIGYPIAYGIARATPGFRTILLMLIILPFWTSFLVRVYAWIGILSPHGLINNWLMSWGIIAAPLNLIDNIWAVGLGIVYSYLPFMILPLYAALEKIDPSLTEAAFDLGCRPLKAFFAITVPQSISGAIAGSILVFLPAVGEFVIPELLGGSDTLMIGRVLWNEFFINRDWPVASALAIAMLLLLVLPLAIFQKLQDRAIKEKEA